MIEIPPHRPCSDQMAKTAEVLLVPRHLDLADGLRLQPRRHPVVLQHYLDNGLDADQFQTIDQEGVGQLIQMSVEKGRATRPDLKIGICGEQGGDPASVDFCFRCGLNYVSCSPYRVPIARLAAAQSAIKAKK